jgi:hypothetical protein
MNNKRRFRLKMKDQKELNLVFNQKIRQEHFNKLKKNLSKL